MHQIGLKLGTLVSALRCREHLVSLPPCGYQVGGGDTPPCSPPPSSNSSSSAESPATHQFTPTAANMAPVQIPSPTLSFR